MKRGDSLRLLASEVEAKPDYSYLFRRFHHKYGSPGERRIEVIVIVTEEGEVHSDGG